MDVDAKRPERTGLSKVYLILYNSSMFVAFSTTIGLLLQRDLDGTLDKSTLAAAAQTIKLLTYTQLLEVVHPMFGLVPGGSLLPLMQITGRMLANGFLTDPAIRRDTGPFVKYLFIVWSAIELFRYSFYALRLLKIDLHPITWARYTLFLPLYPLGGFCEAQVLLTAAEKLDKTGALSYSLPNRANASFHAPSFLRFYVYVLLGPAIIHMMLYMISQRNKQLKSKSD